MNVLPAFKKIKTFVLDVDGVLTDSSILVLNDGQFARKMNIKDGYALQLAIKKGYNILVISGGTSEAVKTRLQKLGITDVFIEVKDKAKVLMKYVIDKELLWEEVLYMGDDIPDLAVMKMCGLACCPVDAVAEIKQVSQYVSPIGGGDGCVRDVIEKVLKLNDHWHHDAETVSK
ncbi:MAG: 3-deoxy-D-manno-octulosonate 8-phosphate phosphatase [Ferruginibacter sp.]